MMGSKSIPDRKDLIDYNYAVAGHAGTLCDPDGELFIKPCTEQEIAFYTSANAEHTDFAELMPVFMGTLLLNDATDIASINEQLPVVAEHLSEHMKEEVVALAHSLHPKPEPSAVGSGSGAVGSIASPWAPGKNRKISTDTAIVLENSAYGFARPNIMDCKLGVRLWADDAPDEKKARFDRISAETTHRDLGFRIAGMRVFRGSADPAQLDPEGYRKYDKDWGRLSVGTHNIVESVRRFVFNPAAGVSDGDARLVCQAVREDLRRVEEVLAREESRMYSASLLFVIEGDGEALARAIKASREAAAVKAEKARAKAAAAEHRHSSSTGLSNSRVDSGIDVGDDGELIVQKEDAVVIGGALEAYDDDNDDEYDEDEDEVSLPKIYSLRLIDFAHANWVPGQGPDENVLKGVRSLIKIFGELSE